MTVDELFASDHIKWWSEEMDRHKLDYTVKIIFFSRIPFIIKKFIDLGYTIYDIRRNIFLDSGRDFVMFDPPFGNWYSDNKNYIPPKLYMSVNVYGYKNNVVVSFNRHSTITLTIGTTEDTVLKKIKQFNSDFSNNLAFIR